MTAKEVENQVLAFVESQHLEKAIELIINQYQKKIYYQVRRYITFHDEADDILQEVFIKVWKGLPNFKFESALTSWIYRITVNECLGYIRSNKKHLHNLDAQAYENHLKSDVFFDGDEFERKLQSAVAMLPEKQRVVFIYKYFEDLKYEQIADILGGTVGSLKASYHHAVKKIEQYLNDD